MEKYEKALKEVFAVTFGQSEEAMEMLKAEYEESDKSQSLESFAWWSGPINLGDCDYNLACRLFKKLMKEKGYRQIENEDLHGVKLDRYSRFRDIATRAWLKARYLSGYFEKNPTIQRVGDWDFFYLSPRKSYENKKKGYREYNKWKKTAIRYPKRGFIYSPYGE